MSRPARGSRWLVRCRLGDVGPFSRGRADSLAEAMAEAKVVCVCNHPDPHEAWECNDEPAGVRNARTR